MSSRADRAIPAVRSQYGSAVSLHTLSGGRAGRAGGSVAMSKDASFPPTSEVEDAFPEPAAPIAPSAEPKALGGAARRPVKAFLDTSEFTGVAPQTLYLKLLRKEVLPWCDPARGPPAAQDTPSSGVNAVKPSSASAVAGRALAGLAGSGRGGEGRDGQPQGTRGGVPSLGPLRSREEEEEDEEDLDDEKEKADGKASGRDKSAVEAARIQAVHESILEYMQGFRREGTEAFTTTYEEGMAAQQVARLEVGAYAKDLGEIEAIPALLPLDELSQLLLRVQHAPEQYEEEVRSTIEETERLRAAHWELIRAKLHRQVDEELRVTREHFQRSMAEDAGSTGASGN